MLGQIWARHGARSVCNAVRYILWVAAVGRRVGVQALQPEPVPAQEEVEKRSSYGRRAAQARLAACWTRWTGTQVEGREGEG